MGFDFSFGLDILATLLTIGYLVRLVLSADSVFIKTPGRPEETIEQEKRSLLGQHARRKLAWAASRA